MVAIISPPKITFLVLVGLLLLSACQDEVEPTTEFERKASLAPSATFYPDIPDQPDDEFIGRSNPTQAALAAEGQPVREADVTIETPEQSSVPMQVFTTDNILLQFDYYGQPSHGGGLIFLLHDADETGASWDSFARTLQGMGYQVIVPDIRGYGLTGGAVDWLAAVDDITLLVANVPALGIANADTPLGFVGVGQGANLSLLVCINLSLCRAEVMVSPAESGQPLDIRNAASQALSRPVYLVSADDDAIGTNEASQLNTILVGEHFWQRYSSGGRGGQLFGNQPQLTQQLTQWLVEHIAPAQ